MCSIRLVKGWVFERFLVEIGRFWLKIVINNIDFIENIDVFLKPSDFSLKLSIFINKITSIMLIIIIKKINFIRSFSTHFLPSFLPH